MSDTDVPLETLLRHRHWVRRVARSLARDVATADDLEQELWLRALDRRPSRESSVGAWARQVLRRLDHNRARSDGRRRRREEARAAGPQRVSDPTIDIVQRAELQRAVAEAVHGLREPYRTTVLLRHFEGLGPVAVAARLGVPVDTVRSRLRRARAELRQELDAVHDGDRRAWLLPLVVEFGMTSAEGNPDEHDGSSTDREWKLMTPVTTAFLVASVALSWWLWPSDLQPSPAPTDGTLALESTEAPGRSAEGFTGRSRGARRSSADGAPRDAESAPEHADWLAPAPIPNDSDRAEDADDDAESAALVVQVRDAAGGEVPGAMVYLLREGVAGLHLLAPPTPFARTDLFGEVEFEDLDGRYVVGVAAAGRAVVHATLDTRSFVEPLVVTLAPVSFTAVLEGRVVSSGNGDPVAGATVAWSSVLPDGVQGFRFPGPAAHQVLEGKTVTDGNGAFRFEGLPATRVGVTVLHHRFVDPDMGREIDAPAADVELSVDESAVVRVALSGEGLEHARRGSMELRPRVEGQPGGAYLDLNPERLAAETLEFPYSLIFPGEYELTVRVEGVGAARVPVSVAEFGERLTVRAELAPLPVLEVTVEGAWPDGLDDEDGHVLVWTPGVRLPERHSLPRGTGTLELFPGDYELEYFDRERVTTRVPLRIEPGERSTARLRTRPATIVRVSSGSLDRVHVSGANGDRVWLRQYADRGAVVVGQQVPLRPGQLLILPAEGGLTLHSATEGFVARRLVAGRELLIELD